MKKDKGSLIYVRENSHGENSPGVDQRTFCFKLLKPFCENVFISCRKPQLPLVPKNLPVIIDSVKGHGPGVGLLSAARAYPNVSWFVIACDFPQLNSEVLQMIYQNRDSTQFATIFKQMSVALIEPLLGIWEPSALKVLDQHFQVNRFSPRHVLEGLDCKSLIPPEGQALLNINSSQEYREYHEIMSSSVARFNL